MWSDRDDERGAAPARLLFGLLVVSLGVIFLGANLRWFDGREVLRQFWPVALVAIGVSFLMRTRETGSSRLWGIVWIVGGSWIYAQNRGWIRVDFWDVFFPAALILVGGSLVWRSFRGGSRYRRLGERGSFRRRRAAIGDDFIRGSAIMSGSVLRSTSTAFRGADLMAFMGGVNLDLSEAKMEETEATVDVTAFWGGIEIRVPKEWSVTSKVIPFMGGYEDKTRPTGTVPTKRLIVRGAVVMGGVEVKS